MSSILKLSSPETRQFWEIPVLYEDDGLLAVDKPADLPVVAEGEGPVQPCLMKLLHAAIAEGKPWTRERGLSFLMNAHRLDADATGVLLLARSKEILAALADVFGSEKPRLSCLALVQGAPDQEQFEIDAKLAPHPTRPELMHVNARDGKRSRTLFQVRESFRQHTLLACEPLTQRTHQVRVHLRYARLPVVGDPLYHGPPLLLSRLKPDYRLKPGRRERPLFDRAAVHAETLQLAHPVSGAPLSITAPLPKDFKVALKYLRHYAASPA